MIRTLLLTAAVLMSACGATSGTLAGPSSVPSATAGPIGFPDVVLPEIDARDQMVRPVAMATRSDPDVAAGYKRIWSETGGWSLDLPAEWIAETSSLRGAEIYVREPALGERGSAMASHVGAGRVSVVLAYDHDRLGLAGFAGRWAPNGSGAISQHANLTIAGQNAETLRIEPNMGPPGTGMAHRHWIVGTPHFVDRYVAINAWPADGVHHDALEQIAASLRIYKPASGPSVMRDRASVLAQAAAPNGKPLTLTRAEAKLVRYAELEQHLGSRSFVTDPDTPVWVVALAGDLSHYARSMRGGPGAGTPLAPNHVVLTSEARTGQGFMFGASGEPWPKWWDSLHDRAP